MNLLLYAEPIRGIVTRLDIDGQGADARLLPGSPLRIKGTFKVQNPNSDPTDTVQLILFLEDKFLKCIYNDVPASAPNFTSGTFSHQCTVPQEKGTYRIRLGVAYNWNWPDQAYNYLLSQPSEIQDIGYLIVGAYEEEKIEWLPIAIVAIPIATIIGIMALSKKKR